MDKYMGLDVHSTSCTLAVISSQGRRLHEAVVETDASALRNAVKAIRGTRHLCVEEGTHSAWIHEILDSCVDELVVTRLDASGKAPRNGRLQCVCSMSCIKSCVGDPHQD